MTPNDVFRYGWLVDGIVYPRGKGIFEKKNVSQENEYRKMHSIQVYSSTLISKNLNDIFYRL